MIAILSDIHGNLEALEAVLADTTAFDVEAMYCLGDLVGYGPDPIPCIEKAMSWDVVLLGNFEHAGLLTDGFLEWGVYSARDTLLRFRNLLQDHPRSRLLTHFLTLLPKQFTSGNALFVHGTPFNPLHEYLFPEDIYNAKKMDRSSALFGTLCFCGHSHIPGIFFRTPSAWEFISPVECDSQFTPSSGKVICNVGSVGQPRDGDPRACYVLFEPGKIIFRRVDYDIERTIRKIREGGGDDVSGWRLREGK